MWGSSTSNVLTLTQQGVTPALVQRNTTTSNSNTGATVGTAARIECFYNNSTTDYLKCGSAASATGVNAGNTNAADFFIFSRNTLNAWNGKIAAIGAWNGLPSVSERAELDAWVTRYYSAGVLV